MSLEYTLRREQLRPVVFAVALLLIGVALIAEPPGTVAAIGYAVVIAVILFAVLRERRARR